MSNQASTVPTNPTCPDCGTPLASGALAGMCPACLLKSGASADSVTQAGRVPFVPPTVEELAALFPALEIIELIGKGGMGAVYKARQRQLDRIVALKVLPPALGDDATFAERFAREAKALAKLNHPSIVTLYEFGRADLPVRQGGEAAQQHRPTAPLFYILMEFVDGVNLRQLLSGGRISPREALAIVPQICDALQFAHDRGIVHRDIKPENLLLDRRGAVKVADFGLAKLIEPGGADLPVSPDNGAAQQHGPTGVMGTPRYMAPEQSERPSEVDHRADIYALGVVFYQMLTGELPAKELRPPSTKVQIDVRLDEIVLRALERNPSQRYAAVSEMKTQVETVAGSRDRRSESQPKEKLSSREEPETPKRRSTIGRAFIWATMTFAVTAGLAAVAGLWIDPIYASRSRVSVVITLPDNVLRLGTPSDFDEQWLKRVLSDSNLLDLASDPKLREWLDQKSRGQLTTKQETLSVLRQSLEIRRSHAPAFFEIWTYDINAANAASAADRIAELLTKRGVALTSSALDNDPAIANAQRTDKAIQPLRPVFPNWYAIISGCFLLSILTGLIRLRLTKTNLPPRNATLPDGGPVVATALVVIWWFAAFPFVAFIADSVRRPNALATAACFLALLLPFLWLLAKHQTPTWMADDAGRLWLRAFAWVGWTFALPAVGFAMFFFHALLSERGGWNPAPSEALIVPTIFLGAILLPAAAIVLWGASGTSRRASLRMAIASSAATIALVLIFGGGSAVLNRAELNLTSKGTDAAQEELKSRIVNQAQLNAGGPQIASRNTNLVPDFQIRRVLKDSEADVPFDEMPSPYRGPNLRVERAALLDGSAISVAFWDVAPNKTNPAPIRIKLTTDAATKFQEITRTNVSRQLAIFVQGKVLSAPNITEEVKGGVFQLPGPRVKEEWDSLLKHLNSGSSEFSNLRFGTVNSLIIPNSPRGQPAFLSLESGRWVTNPPAPTNTRQFQEWRRSNNVDLAGRYIEPGSSGADIPMVLTFNLALVDVGKDSWNRILPKMVRLHWDLQDQLAKPMDAIVAKESAGTYLFRTERDVFGALEVQGATPDGSGVRIRYKLVEHGSQP